MNKHTPGPWHRSYGNYVYQGSHWLTDRKRLIAIAEPSTRTQEDWDQVFANARLIAAAPDLLEVLSEIVDEGRAYERKSSNKITWLEKAEEIIKKARGE